MSDREHETVKTLMAEIERLDAKLDALREAIIEHRDQKWRDNGFRYDDWDSRLYRKAGVHPLEHTQ